MQEPNCLLLVSLLWLIASSIYAGRVKRHEEGEIIYLTIPVNVHLSLGNNASTMIIVWSSKGEIEGGWAMLNYSTDASSLNNAVKALWGDLTTDNPNGIENYYRVVLQNLLPRTRYFYLITMTNYTLGPLSFVTQPSHEHWSPSLLVFSDLGGRGSDVTLRRLLADSTSGRYAAVIHAGDFAAGLRGSGGMDGDAFLAQIHPMASRIPYMTCYGEKDKDITTEYLQQYGSRFSMPTFGLTWPMNRASLVYSFTLGPATFISYSTEDAVNQDGNPWHKLYYDLLEKELRKASSVRVRSRRPWIIVFGHRPMYCSAARFSDCDHAADVRNVYEKLFIRYGVDLSISGHVHAYERTFPVFNNTVAQCNYTNPKAPVHVVAGFAGGCRLPVCFDVILQKKGAWSAARHWLPSLQGYGRLTVFNNTHLQWNQISALTGSVIDSFTIEQHKHGTFIPPKTAHRCP